MALTTINSGGVKDDSIVNADIKSDAAIALSKIASTPSVLTGSTNNTICTVTGANAIQGEANLTFDGNNLAQTIDASGEGVKLTAAGNHYVAFVGDSNRSSGGTYCTSFQGKWNGTTIGAFNVVTGADNTDKDDGVLELSTKESGGNETVRLKVHSAGDVEVKTGNLKIGTAGKGIDFSATSHASGMTSELLDSYEEGSWTPTLTQSAGLTLTNNEATYTRIGRQVHAYTYISWQGTPSSGSTTFRIGGLPFTAKSGNTYGSNTILFMDDFTFTNLRPLVYQGQNFVYFHKSSGTANTVDNNDMVEDTGNHYMILGLSYQT